MLFRNQVFSSSICYFILALVAFTDFQSVQAQSESLYQSGKRAYSKRNYDLALNLFKQSIKGTPSNGNSWFYIGRIYNDQKKISKAIHYFEQAVHLPMDRNLREQALWKINLYHNHKRNWNKLYEYSSLFLLKIKPNKKIQRFKEMSEEKRTTNYSSNHSSQMHSASELSKSGKIDKAISIYSQLLSKDSDYHPARWKFALLLMKKKKFSEANSQFKYLILNDKPDWEYHYKSAICHYKLDESAKSLNEIAQAEKTNRKKSKIFLYHNNYLKGRIYLKSYLYKDSCRAFGIARKNNSKPSSKMLSYLALANLECGRFKKAKAAATDALKKNANNNIARLVNVRLFIVSGKKANAYKKTKQLLKGFTNKKLLGIHSGYTPAFFFLGKEASRKKNYNIAKKAFHGVNVERLTIDTKIARLENRKSDSLWDYNYYYGLALLNTNEIDRSIILFDKLKKNERSWYLLSKANARKGNVSQAKKYLLKSTNIKKKRWIIAQQDSDFTQLMKKNKEFNQFILTRNQPIAKKKIIQ